KKLWRIPMLQSCSNEFNESSWAHYVLQPIVNFLVDFKESDICPIKKNDIFGTYESEDRFNLEMLLGEISNGPFNQSTKAQKHTKEDKIKLSKCGKDALDQTVKRYMKFQIGNSDDLEKLN
ncbi:3733_t:CDS:2, partial [Racocetra fulgida]